MLDALNQGEMPPEGAGAPIKSGDVIAVEHTFATDFRLVLSQMINLTAGVRYDFNNTKSDD